MRRSRLAPPPAFVVEVNEGVVEASRQGLDWWNHFRIHHRDTGRIAETTLPHIVGGKVEVFCDDRDHADWLAGFMVDHGQIPRTAVRVKRAEQQEEHRG